MKTIGMTPESGYIVEMTREEYQCLDYLAKAIEGKTLDELMWRHSDPAIKDFDFSGVFGSIEAFALANYRINELQDLINQLRQSIGTKEAENPEFHP